MTEKLKPCPFCGATPHRGLSKVKHDQLHGYSYQDTTIKCPHLCASMEGGLETVVERWNTRATVTPQEAAKVDMGIVEYVLRDDMHNRLTPRVVDISYSAFMQAKQPNNDDGGPSDWFNDTRPMVMEKMAEIRRAISEDSHD